MLQHGQFASRTRSWLRLLILLAGLGLTMAQRASAVILWSDLGATLVHENGEGTDILGGAVRRDETASDTLYFKFHVDPLSDVSTEEYSAGFQLFEHGEERLGVGNSLKAWAYSAFNTAETGLSNRVFGDLDLHTSRPEPSGLGAFFPYELPRHGIESTIIFKVQYFPNSNDLVTVWLNPNLAPGTTETNQPQQLTTTFAANARFDEIHLRHSGGGGGWTFSDMAIATSFNDFVAASGQREGTPESGGSNFSFRSWRRDEGLPQDSVRALAQTTDGYMWVGSDDGVTRFDGLRFAFFGLPEGLHSGPVRVLLGDSAGALWIGSAGGGLTCYAQGRFTTFTTRDGLPSDSIRALAQEDSGRLWVGTEEGLVVWDRSKVVPFPAADFLKRSAINFLVKDRHGHLWVGARGLGVFEYNNQTFQQLNSQVADELLMDPHSLLVDRSDRLWVGAGDDFVLCRADQEWRRYRIPHHLERPYVTALAEEPDGTVWAGSVSEGLFQFHEGKLTAVNAASGLSDNLVKALWVDQEGLLWVGTDNGLNLLRRKHLYTYGAENGLGYGAVQGMAEVSPGVIWVAKPDDGLYQWSESGFSRFTNGLQHLNPQLNTLLCVTNSGVWVGGAQGVIHCPFPQAGQVTPEPVSLKGLNVITLSPSRDGGVWAGTREGQVWRWRDEHWQPQSNLWQANPITAILEEEHRIWVGTEGGGLFAYEDSGIKNHFDKTSGLFSDVIRTLHLDQEGTLWIGTAGGGLSRWRHGKVKTFTTHEGLPDDTISQILEDANGRLWLGSNRGVACASKRELEELAVGKVLSIYPQVYGAADGMLSEECTGGFTPSGLKNAYGLLWFGTLKGIVVADPRPRATDMRVPKVVLEEIMVDNAPLRVSDFAGISNSGEHNGGLCLPPGPHRLELRYTGLSFHAPDRVRFRYRLEGLDPDWVDAGTRRTADYSYVPPGQYTFQVNACNNDGVWSESGPKLELIVEPHFWQTWWFMGMAGLGLLGAVGGTARFVEKGKLHHRLQHLEQERALERERARIAQDLHDDLGSALTRLSLLSDLIRADKEHPEQTEVHALKMAQASAHTVRALEEIVWAVRPGSDTLQSLLDYITHFANELFEGDRTRCRLRLPSNPPVHTLPPEMRHNIFLIIKEALTNTLKHAHAAEVLVQAEVADGVLELSVEDDGRGFDPQAPPGQGKRHGLGNLRRRAEAVGGTLTVEGGPGRGARIRLRLKLPPETAPL